MKPRFWPTHKPSDDPQIVDLLVMDEDYRLFGLVGLDVGKASISDFLNDMPKGTVISIYSTPDNSPISVYGVE